MDDSPPSSEWDASRDGGILFVVAAPGDVKTAVQHRPELTSPKPTDTGRGVESGSHEVRRTERQRALQPALAHLRVEPVTDQGQTSRSTV